MCVFVTVSASVNRTCTGPAAAVKRYVSPLVQVVLLCRLGQYLHDWKVFRVRSSTSTAVARKRVPGTVFFAVSDAFFELLGAFSAVLR